MNATHPVYVQSPSPPHPPPPLHPFSLQDVLTMLVQVAFLLLVARQFQLHEPDVAKALANAVVANHWVYIWVALGTSALLISCAPYLKSLMLTIIALAAFSATAFFIFAPKERVEDIIAFSNYHFDKAWARSIRGSSTTA